ncbi:response regulator transcription factor [Aquiluna sp. KACHI24]|uniref:winged helix-turn-helix transcriptional regulator n=1 Tax=Aquiluna sp. KACHI24 TaxID=2968831 RepID=UPI00220645BB|nr:response regulator transcription factor [Aquiluna sp. KACHI24]BDQ00685.1 putative transcriptional regulatory protein [Aquiluna sp. KACHI24]
MATVLLITPSQDALASQFELLGHSVTHIAPDAAEIANAKSHDLTVLDCRQDLIAARGIARILVAAGWDTPVILLVQDQALAVITTEWGASDFLLANASLAEIDARVRLAVGKTQTQTARVNTGLVIDEVSYTAKINGRTLDLTFKEFELLRHLNDNPGRVFTREQLLSEVWGYDYFGGTRTVDVHIRRLRAKLGEMESLIGTVRNVGYRLDPNQEGESD